MHKYWKRPVTLTVIVLLVFMMTLPLTACQIEIPGIGTVNIKDSDLPNNGGNMSGDDGGDDVDGVNTEGGYDDPSTCCARRWTHRPICLRRHTSAVRQAVRTILSFPCGIG